jgi:DNA-binding FrmR family transcriptional regulator
MSNMKNSDALTRIKTVEGHVHGIVKMIEDEKYCIDIIKQIQAVQAALNKVRTLILDKHLKSCLTTAVRGDDINERERVLSEIADVFETATKV